MLRRLIVVAALAMMALSGVAAPGLADVGFEFTYFPHAGSDIEFANDWGRPRPDDRTHRGNDVFSPKMTPVVAVADGFVTRMAESERAGFSIRLRHADGWETFYLHLNNDTPGTDDNRGGTEQAFAAGVEDGDFVAAGTVIGYVGDSGNAEPTPPHTHFELHRNGVALNPYLYLRSAWLRQKRALELYQLIF